MDRPTYKGNRKEMIHAFENILQVEIWKKCGVCYFDILEKNSAQQIAKRPLGEERGALQTHNSHRQFGGTKKTQYAHF